jgi:hypothetical protein
MEKTTKPQGVSDELLELFKTITCEDGTTGTIETIERLYESHLYNLDSQSEDSLMESHNFATYHFVKHLKQLFEQAQKDFGLIK